jgi:hypothetical protein
VFEDGRMVAVMVEGERDCALVDVGESTDDPARLTESRAEAWDGREWGPPGPFGLSLPVGPLPRGALLAGGRFKAARRLPFSSSSSATRCSRAYRRENGEGGGGRKR